MFSIGLLIISIIHIMFILFVVIVPFTSNNYLLLLHAITIPFLLAHWVTNNNMCFLTLVEHNIRTKLYGQETNRNEYFMVKLIEPIYDFKQNNQDFSTWIYIITIGLWFVTISKLYTKCKTGEIEKFNDLFKL